jgi:hypothetical protein
MIEHVPARRRNTYRRKSSSGWVWILSASIVILSAAIIFAAYLLAHRRPAIAGTAVARGSSQPPGETPSAPVPAGGAASPASALVEPAKPTASPAPAIGARLAPEGSFYMVEYVSAKTPKGIVGFEPGRTVKLVEVHRPQGTLIVTDGRYQAEVLPSQLTNDKDIAELARDRDAASQAKLAELQAAEHRVYEQMQKQTNEEYSKDVERNNAVAQAGKAIGTADNPLNAAPSPTNTSVNLGAVYGSPYSYFAPNAVIPPQVANPPINTDGIVR